MLNLVQVRTLKSTIFFLRGQALLQNEQYIQAALIFAQAAEEDESAALFYGIGLSFYLSDLKGIAIYFFKKAIKIDPSFKDAYKALGVIYNDFKDYDHSLIFYNQAIQVNSKNPQLYYERGNVRYNAGAIEEAHQDFEKAAQLNSAFVEAHICLGMSLRQLGKNETALLAYENALIYKPDSIDGLLGKARSLYFLERFQETIFVFDKLLPLVKEGTTEITFYKDTLTDIYLKRGHSFYKLKKYEKALHDFDAALILAPKNAILYRFVGNTYGRLHQYELAKENLEKAVKLNPHNHEALSDCGKSYYMLGDFEQAILTFTRSLEATDTVIFKAQLFFDRGKAYAQAGKYNQALDDYLQSLQLNQRKKKTYYEICSTLVKLERYQAAIHYYSQAIEHFPNVSGFYNNRSNLKSVLDYSFDETIRDSDKAIELDSHISNYYFNRANILFDAGFYKEAFIDYQLAIDLDLQFEEDILKEYCRELVELNCLLVGENNGGLRVKAKQEGGFDGHLNLRGLIRVTNKQQSVEHKAAHLALAIRNTQAFRDGNTRTAGVVLQWVLIEHEARYLNRSAEEIYKKIHNLDDEYRLHEEDAINALVNWMREPRKGKKNFKKSTDFFEDKYRIFEAFKALPKLLQDFTAMEKIADPDKGYVKNPQQWEIFRKKFPKDLRIKFNRYIQVAQATDTSEVRSSPNELLLANQELLTQRRIRIDQIKKEINELNVMRWCEVRMFTGLVFLLAKKSNIDEQLDQTKLLSTFKKIKELFSFYGINEITFEEDNLSLKISTRNSKQDLIIKLIKEIDPTIMISAKALSTEAIEQTNVQLKSLKILSLFAIKKYIASGELDAKVVEDRLNYTLGLIEAYKIIS